jgi:hypothetical protein
MWGLTPAEIARFAEEIFDYRDDERLVAANLIGCGFNDPKQLSKLLKEKDARKAAARPVQRVQSIAGLVSVFQRGGAVVERG